MDIILSPKAREQVRALPQPIAQRIVRKLRWYADQENTLAFAKRLQNSSHGTYRLRIGDYRAVCDVIGNRVHVLYVLYIKHRREAYRIL